MPPLGAPAAALLLGAQAAAAQVFLGPAGNACPSGSTKLLSEMSCRAGMHSIGTVEDYRGSENEGDWPAGCYSCRGVADCFDGVWFNTHATGSANGQARPLCGQLSYMPPVFGMTLFIGDSDIENWPNPSPFHGSYNVGVGEYLCKDVLGEVDQMLATFSPANVVLVCGENDLSVGKSPSRTFNKFSQVVAKAIAAGAR
eukprot:1805043-Prymnesium_polylepis.1